MSAGAKAIPLQGLKRRALSLGAAKAFDHAMQFLLPVVLVRCLDAATFGEYRLLWLAVGTLMYVATLNVPQSLFYFLPRSDAPRRRLYINQTLVFMGFSGLVCALLVSPWSPWIPAALAPLLRYGPLVPAFVLLWILTYVLEFLPTVDERTTWQSLASISLAALRVVILGAGAFFSGSMHVILALLVAFCLVRLGVLLCYIGRYHGLRRPLMDRQLFKGQVRLAAPMGVSNALFGLRWQADQWVAAHLFSLTSFAAFSVAGVFGAIVNIFRTSVNGAFLPSMSRLQAAGDVRGMLELNGRANVMVGTLLFPMLAFGFVFAEEVVTVIYTAQYLEAAPVMRLYICAFCLMVVEVGSIVLLLDEGRYAVRVNAVAICFSVAASLAAALTFGLWGAAVGGVLAIYFDRFMMLRRISVRTGVPLARVQDWRGLLVALVFASGCAAIAWHIDRAFMTPYPPIERLIAGGSVLAATYGLVLAFQKLSRRRKA